MEASKVPASAFALFCSRRRLETKKELEEKSPNHKAQLGEVQKALSVAWKELTAEEKQRWTEEFEELKEQHQRRQQEVPQGLATDEAATSPVALEFPQARVVKIVKLLPSVKKLSAEGARLLNMATAAALRQFVAWSISERANDKTLTLEDVLAMITRGGLPLKFLQECKYAIAGGGTEELEELLDEGTGDIIAIEPPPTRSFPPRPQPVIASIRKQVKTGKGAPMRTADIASFFKRA